MELIDIAKQIELCIQESRKARLILKERGIKRAETATAYDREIAMTLIALKNGVEFDLDGQKILNPPTTTTDKIAKGICWKEKLEAEKADAMYKSVISNLNAIQAEMNAFQSLHKNLKEM